MLHEFLEANRADLIERCRAKVALRSAPRPTLHEMEHGIPMFLGQLIATLRDEQQAMGTASRKGSTHGGPSLKLVPHDIAASATKHGGELLGRGFSVDQVVHDYGDLCQAVTELAIEKKALISTDEFHTLNKCLDDAIADAVTEYGWQRDKMISETGAQAMNERLGELAHELRNLLNTAMLSFAAIKSGSVGLVGSTSAVLERSLAGLRDLIDRALTDVRLTAGVPTHCVVVAIDDFVAEIQVAAGLEAAGRGHTFTVHPVPSGLAVKVDKAMLFSAAFNLLQNAFKFTRPKGHITLRACGKGNRVLIEVQDQCGGLPDGKAEALFLAFHQHHDDRSGVGLGLSVSRRAVEANGGKLLVRDLPGIGCVFTIELPRWAGEIGEEVLADSGKI